MPAHPPPPTPDSSLTSLISNTVIRRCQEEGHYQPLGDYCKGPRGQRERAGICPTTCSGLASQAAAFSLCLWVPAAPLERWAYPNRFPGAQGFSNSNPTFLSSFLTTPSAAETKHPSTSIPAVYLHFSSHLCPAISFQQNPSSPSWSWLKSLAVGLAHQHPCPCQPRVAVL